MDEDLAHWTRSVAAELSAQRFILDYLLRAEWVQLTRGERLQMAEALLDTSMQSKHLAGLAEGDELYAANLADITVRMQGSVDQFVGRALKAIGDAEDKVARRRVQEDDRR